MFKYNKYLTGFGKRRLKKEYYDKLEAIKELKKVEIRPSELIKYLNLIEIDEKMRIALKKNLTKYFFQELDYVSQKITNIFVNIIGKPGSGKSTIAKTIATLLRDKCVEFKKQNPHIFLCYDSSDMTESFKNVKQGDIIFRDENPDEQGEYSMREQKAIRTFAGLVRDLEISFILVSPYDFNFKIVNIKLIALGIDFENKTNRALWVDENNNPLGVVYLPYIENEELFEQMKARKREIQQYSIETGGKHYIRPDLERQNADIEKVYDYFKKEKIISITKKAILSYFDDLGIPPDRDYRDKIASRVRELLLKEKEQRELEKRLEREKKLAEIKAQKEEEKQHKQDPDQSAIKARNKDDSPKYGRNPDNIYLIKLESGEKVKIQYEFVEEWVDSKFYTEIYNEMIKNINNDERIKFSKRDATIFDEFCQGAEFRYILGKYKVNHHRVKKIKNDVMSVIWRYAELVYHKYLINKYKTEVQYVGGNYKEPDYVIPSLKQVHSFKTFLIDDKSRAMHSIGHKEILVAKEMNFDLYLVVYIFFDKKFRLFKVHFL